MKKSGKKYLALICGLMITLTGCGGGNENLVGSDAVEETPIAEKEPAVTASAPAEDTSEEETKAPEADDASAEAAEEESNINPPFLADEKLYGDVISKLSDDMYIAFVDLGMDNDLLIAASKDTVFDNGDNEMASTEGDLYCINKDGEVVELGHIEGGGTATPLAVYDGFIYYANHSNASTVKVNDDMTGVDVNDDASFDDYDKAMVLNFSPVGDTEGTGADNAVTELPSYEYPEKDSVNYAIAKYLIDEIGKDYDQAQVCIPTIQAVATDESNTDDIQVYGDFFVYNYDLKEDTLECQSGGNYPGVMHLKKTDAGYEVTSFEVCEDGSEFDDSAKKLFGDHYDDFMKIYSDETTREDVRKQTISDYVLNNSLPISYYQDYGWEPVYLGEEGYNGPDDFVQEQSGKTEFKDFDDVIANLKEGQGYAKINLYGYDGDVLAVAETVFEADNSAPEASLYVDIGSGAVQRTIVSGNGSAFPLRIEDGILYAGDNHTYTSYFAYENEDTVGIMVKDNVTDGDGAGEYSGFLREDNSYDNDKDFTGGQKEFEEMMSERDKKPVLEFTVVK